jgi:hypothetical protein
MSSLPSINVPGQLAIKTIHGRNGDFNVGRLTTPIGEFVTKNAELEQYKEGKYDGDFNIVNIRPSMYISGGRMVIEMRATLGGMTLSSIESLTKDEAHRLSPQEVDPIDEEAQPSAAVATPELPAEKVPSESPVDPLIDTTPFSIETFSSSEPAANDTADADAKLFGPLWPLGELVKLDATVDRRVLRQQRDRLDKLGYEFEPRSQDWHLKIAA